jgi:hypothetical protein
MGLLIENCKLNGTREGSVFVRGNVIERVSESPAQPVPEETQRIDGRGGALLAGLTDTHCHPFSLGRLRRSVDLRGTRSIAGLRLRLYAAVQKTKAGEWVVGGGWDHESLSERRLPSRKDIDDISRDNPVVLTRVCGHISLLNSMAIRVLGLEGVRGPGYDVDEGGSLTGIIREGAQEDAFGRMPKRSSQECLEDILSAELEAARCGLTTLHCVLSEEGYRQELEALASLAGLGNSSLRYRVYVPFQAVGYLAESGLRTKLNNERVRLNGVKIYADGSLGASTAALREPYADDRRNSGVLRHSDEELGELVDKADSAGYQVIVHAIGDRAIEQAVSALSRVSGGENQRRHRVEHASLLPKDLRSKMRRYNIRATVQPSFIVSDSWAARRLGEERVNDLYPLRSMLEEGIMASGSSDAPVESLSPIVGMWAAMVRGGYGEREKLGPWQSIALYTDNAATNGFDEGTARIAEGGRADFTLLDSDMDDMHPAMFRKVGTAATVVDGRVAYSFEGT